MFFRQSDKQILARIREEIRSRLSALAMPRQVEDFLLEKWSLLLRDIYMSRGGEHADWQAGWDTVDALLWSLSTKESRQETERMLRILPVLLGRLQEGCTALGMAEDESGPFLKQLAEWHAAVASSGLQPSREGGALRSLSPVEPVAVPALELAGRQAGETPAPGMGAVAPSLLDRLHPGAWVTFRCVGGDKDLCLQWISATGNMFLFADSQGLDALSLTRQRLQERLDRGELSLRG
jgi:hypothetical protein